MSEVLDAILEADKKMVEKKIIDGDRIDVHMSCFGLLCEKLDMIHYQRPTPEVTMRPLNVTCPKCIEIMKERGILK